MRFVSFWFPVHSPSYPHGKQELRHYAYLKGHKTRPENVSLVQDPSTNPSTTTIPALNLASNEQFQSITTTAPFAGHSFEVYPTITSHWTYRLINVFSGTSNCLSPIGPGTHLGSHYSEPFPNPCPSKHHSKAVPICQYRRRFFDQVDCFTATLRYLGSRCVCFGIALLRIVALDIALLIVPSVFFSP